MTDTKAMQQRAEVVPETASIRLARKNYYSI